MVLFISSVGGGGIFSGATQSKIRLKFVYSNRPINTLSRSWTEETREYQLCLRPYFFQRPKTLVTSVHDSTTPSLGMNYTPEPVIV